MLPNLIYRRFIYIIISLYYILIQSQIKFNHTYQASILYNNINNVATIIHHTTINNFLRNNNNITISEISIKIPIITC